MAQYIDKSALVAEIKKTEKLSKNKAKNAVDTYFKIHFDGWATACRSILSYLDTLEVKEVDLEQISKHYALNNSPWDDCWPEMQDAFKAGFELGLKVQKGE